MAFEREKLRYWIVTSEHSFPSELQEKIIPIVLFQEARVLEVDMLALKMTTAMTKSKSLVSDLPKQRKMLMEAHSFYKKSFAFPFKQGCFYKSYNSTGKGSTQKAAREEDRSKPCLKRSRNN